MQLQTTGQTNKKKDNSNILAAAPVVVKKVGVETLSTTLATCCGNHTKVNVQSSDLEARDGEGIE